jgi:hypothetical protein
MNPSVPKRHFEGRTFACHAPPLGSRMFTEVQEVPLCKAFGPGVFTAARCDSEYLLCVQQLGRHEYKGVVMA